MERKGCHLRKIILSKKFKNEIKNKINALKNHKNIKFSKNAILNNLFKFSSYVILVRIKLFLLHIAIETCAVPFDLFPKCLHDCFSRLQTRIK